MANEPEPELQERTVVAYMLGMVRRQKTESLLRDLSIEFRLAQSVILNSSMGAILRDRTIKTGNRSKFSECHLA